MSEGKIYPVPAAVAAHAWINNDQYLAMYQRSVDDPEGFWAEQAEQFVTWFKPWDKVLDWDFTKGHIRWFEGATLNVSYNCLDRHLATRGDQVAIIWEGDNPKEDKKITYKELHEDVCKFANVLKSLGRQERGSDLHLHADDPRNRGRHAGLHPDRRDPLHRVRRLLAGIAEGPHPRRDLQPGHHLRRRFARRSQCADEGQH